MPDAVAEAVDVLVSEGVFNSRSDAVRAGLDAVVERERRAAIGRSIVTRTVRGIPTEVPLGSDEGLPVECAASFDNLQPVNRTLLTERIGALPATRRREVCGALDALADC